MSLEREHAAGTRRVDRPAEPRHAQLRARPRRSTEYQPRRAPRSRCMLIDLDDFKRVNDTLGHQVGDDLLASSPNGCARSIRPGDQVARLGGDEFAVLVLDVGRGRGRAVAERIPRRGLEPIALEGLPLEIELSIGYRGLPATRRRRPRRCSGMPTSRCTRPRHERTRHRRSTRRDRDDELRRPARPLGRAAAGPRRRRRSSCSTSRSRDATRSQHDRRRGAGPLAAPAARLRRAGRVHPAGRAVRHHAAASPSGSSTLALAPDGGLAGATGSTCRSRSTSRRPTCVGGDLATLIACGLAAATASPPAMLQLEITERMATHQLDEAQARLAELRALGVDASASTTSAPGTPRCCGCSRCTSTRSRSTAPSCRGWSTAAAAATASSAPDRSGARAGRAGDRRGRRDRARSGDLLRALGCDGAQGWYIARPMSGSDFTTWVWQAEDRQDSAGDELAIA